MFDEPPYCPPTEPTSYTGQHIPAPDKKLQSFKNLTRYIKSGKIPWRYITRRKQENFCNNQIITPHDVGARNGIPFPLRAHRFVSNQLFQAILKERFIHEIGDAAINLLHRTAPENSAATSLSKAQKILTISIITITALFAYQFPLVTIITLNTSVTLYFLLAIGYRVFLLFLGAKKMPTSLNTAPLTEDELPTITILLPLYNDAAALPSLAKSIDQLDYPNHKKDVKLLLEADDGDTIKEAKRLGLHQQYDLITIPESAPRTKPKACNFGMHLAQGKLIVIYDAEDQPERDQLLKAARAFHHADTDLACVQARLNYYNHNDNWLTRMFTLEYSLWFDWLLPALQRLNVPIPLGGTSNFFLTDTLKKLGGWDPYNVTEDADLGLRISKSGYRVEILDSTTFEEANCKTGNWIRQRSRWMKGYMQTWLVHMRHPDRFIATTGWAGLLSVQLFIAGNVLSALINPILWAIFIFWLFTSSPAISAAFPEPLLTLNLFALTFGNLFFIFLACIAPLKRRWFHLCLIGVTAPAYWALTSVAVYKALWQIVTKPHYWEKTDHMISELAIAKREQALRDKL